MMDKVYSQVNFGLEGHTAVKMMEISVAFVRVFLVFDMKVKRLKFIFHLIVLMALFKVCNTINTLSKTFISVYAIKFTL